MLRDGNDADDSPRPLVNQYRQWNVDQHAAAPVDPRRRKEIATELLNRAGVAAKRIGAGIDALSDPVVLEAFRITNRAMNAQAQRRLGIDDPSWRPFQLALVLMNLPAIIDPTDDDRDVVDLLFYPTGGGKTEANLGLAAFTIVLR